MDPEQRRFLKKKYGAAAWPRVKSRIGRRKSLNLQDLTLPNARLIKLSRTDTTRPSRVHAIWQLNDDPDCMIAVSVSVWASVGATHDELLNLLGTIQSGDVTQDADQSAIGEIGFSIHDTMNLFATGNVVVMVRNAGKHVVSVRRISEIVDLFIKRNE
ncbi:hypothetical protein JQ616_31950 [Bradyrhizobium tropiciagri]|uniref:hypothetical protein n=1 Tax=Bradyrhizobium tropiciagri TaxID=312253 RepID=UPI001BAA2532|nr:hypothetical protein [Bradyrhizobium tropiciagri]MBR0899589.1 hypothetical protein [Bradyrhizobium tropiciagri]